MSAEVVRWGGDVTIEHTMARLLTVANHMIKLLEHSLSDRYHHRGGGGVVHPHREKPSRQHESKQELGEIWKRSGRDPGQLWATYGRGKSEPWARYG